MAQKSFIPLTHRKYSLEQTKRRAADFYKEVKARRSVRDFADKPVSKEVIAHCLLAAGTAPNGANLQPWHFVAVSSREVKRRIREAAEAEEREFYERRAPDEWLEALAPLGTDANKPSLERAPYLIAVFAQRYGVAPDGNKIKHYYVSESVGIACGVLVTALHHAGLACLTHTPSPMNFLREILQRPKNEQPYLLLVGYPAENTEVPRIEKKSLEEIVTFLE